MSVILGEADLHEKLMLTSDKFRQLAQEHQSYAQQLEKFSTRSFLTEEEKIQEVTLKKKKLRLKDQMHHMLLRYRKQMEAEI